MLSGVFWFWKIIFKDHWLKFIGVGSWGSQGDSDTWGSHQLVIEGRFLVTWYKASWSQLQVVSTLTYCIRLVPCREISSFLFHSTFKLCFTFKYGSLVPLIYLAAERNLFVKNILWCILGFYLPALLSYNGRISATHHLSTGRSCGR